MDKNFKPDIPPSTQEGKIPQYSFDKGVDVCVARIQELLKTLNRDIYVIINGSGTDVGKTKLCGAIQQKLALADIDRIERQVFFEEEQGKSYKKGSNYREDRAGKKPGLGIDEVPDLYIGIYRTDKPFPTEENYEPVADIMIHNEHAKDAQSKTRYKGE